MFVSFLVTLAFVVVVCSYWLFLSVRLVSSLLAVLCLDGEDGKQNCCFGGRTATTRAAEYELGYNKHEAPCFPQNCRGSGSGTVMLNGFDAVPAHGRH